MPDAAPLPRQSRAIYSFSDVMGSSLPSILSQRAYSKLGPGVAFSAPDTGYIVSAAVPSSDSLRKNRDWSHVFASFSASYRPGLSVEMSSDFKYCNVFPSLVKIQSKVFSSQRLDADVAAYPDDHLHSPQQFVRRLATTAVEIALQNTAEGTPVLVRTPDGYEVRLVTQGAGTEFRVFSNPQRRHVDAAVNTLQAYQVFSEGRVAFSEKQLSCLAALLIDSVRELKSRRWDYE